MGRTLSIVAAVVLLGAYAIVDGLWTDRWGQSATLQSAGPRLDSVPMTFGDWDGKALELDERQVKVAQLSAYLYREYVNRRTGNAVSVLLVCGRPGPVAVHTPDVCYQGAGYNVAAKPARQVLETTEPDEFWMANFQKDQAAVPDPLRIFWGWTATGRWQAPDNPRLAFARSSALYKLYVIRHLASLTEPLDKDPCREFMALWLPELQRSLFPEQP